MCFALNVFASNCSTSNFRSVRIRQAVNNLSIRTDCGLCRERFTPATGLHPVLSTNYRPVCPICASGALDVTTSAEQEKNAADLARFEMLYRAPVLTVCA